MDDRWRADMAPTQPFPEEGLSSGDTQPVKVTREGSGILRGKRWMIAIPSFILVVLAVAVLSGYYVGLEQRQLNREQTEAELTQEQFDLGVEDLLAGRFELASERFEYVLSIDPNYPGAQEFLGEALKALNRPTPTPVPIASPTSTETPDLGSYEGMFQSAQTAFNRGDWGPALDILLLLRGEDPEYRREEVNSMMARALRNRGMDKLFSGQLEQGIYDLSLSARFGPLDNQALSWRRSAEFYLLANSYYGLDWKLSTEYFGEICKANIWAACSKYALSAREYADLLLKDKEYCQAAYYYGEFYRHRGDEGLAPTATKVHSMCLTATAPTPTMTATSTATSTWLPGTGTPTPTDTGTPGVTATATPTASGTPAATDTPAGTVAPTPTPTSTSASTPTSTATATWTFTPAASPTNTSE